jgi:hypothetical protein
MSQNTTTKPSTKKTLDTQHNNKLNEFQQKAERLSTLKHKFNSIYERILELEQRKRSELSKEEHDRLISLIDERDLVKKTIDDLENNDDEVEYLINTAPILFKYYDIVEKGNDDDFNQQKVNENSILKWFVKNPEEKKDTNKEDKASLLEKYMSYTDTNFIKSLENDVKYQCQNCGCDNMNILINDGIIFCNECSCVEYIIVDHDRPSYKDPPREISYYAYKRKRIYALISHMPRYSKFVSWVNICALRLAAFCCC